jgi:hypothetical protein
MAVRTWANTLGVAAGAALLAGAGQLGIGYGLGIVRWDRDFATRGPWHAQLTWIAFLSGVAVLAGGYAGSWYARRARLEHTVAVRVALALSAGVGALVVLPLAVRPAGVSHPPEGGDPRLAAALTVVAGLLIGVIATFAALSVPAVSGSIVATVLWLWIAALISAAYTLGSGASWAAARLGLLPAGGLWVPVTLLVPAALITLAVAGIARFGGSDPWAVGVCGAAGTGLVGLAYLIAGPGGGDDGTAYKTALLAIPVGVAVSIGVAVARRPARETPPPAPASPEAPAEPAVTGNLGRLPSPEGVKESKISEEPAPEAVPEAVAERAPEPPAAPEAPAERAPEAPAERAPQASEPLEAPAAPEPPAQAAEPAGPTEPAEPEPEPKERRGIKVPRLPGLGRRSRRRAEGPVPAPAPDADDHLDWVKGLRAAEAPARVGGESNPRHAKPAEPAPSGEDEG